jgi:hypothetical protein
MAGRLYLSHENAIASRQHKASCSGWDLMNHCTEQKGERERRKLKRKDDKKIAAK